MAMTGIRAILRRPVRAPQRRQVAAAVAGRVGAEPIAAFLLEVGHTSAPLEPERNPTWCGFDDARSKLAERRGAASGEELERVLHAAARAAVR
jgi:hypothetical protein